MSKIDVLEEQIDKGRQAKAILEAAGDACAHCGRDNSIFTSRVDQIVAEATAWFRVGDTEPKTALRYVAALSEVKALHEELLYRERKGEQAHTKLMTNATGGD